MVLPRRCGNANRDRLPVRANFRVSQSGSLFRRRGGLVQEGPPLATHIAVNKSRCMRNGFQISYRKIEMVVFVGSSNLFHGNVSLSRAEYYSDIIPLFCYIFYRI